LKATPDEFLFASVLTFAEIRRGLELLPGGKRRTHLEAHRPRRQVSSGRGTRPSCRAEASPLCACSSEAWHADLEIAFHPRLLPVTKAIGDRWAILSAQAQRRGTPLAIIDGLIAATALEYDLTVVTRNGKDFAGLGIVLFNPWES